MLSNSRGRAYSSGARHLMHVTKGKRLHAGVVSVTAVTSSIAVSRSVAYSWCQISFIQTMKRKGKGSGLHQPWGWPLNRRADAKRASPGVTGAPGGPGGTSGGPEQKPPDACEGQGQDWRYWPSQLERKCMRRWALICMLYSATFTSTGGVGDGPASLRALHGEDMMTKDMNTDAPRDAPRVESYWVTGGRLHKQAARSFGESCRRHKAPLGVICAWQGLGGLQTPSSYQRQRPRLGSKCVWTRRPARLRVSRASTLGGPVGRTIGRGLLDSRKPRRPRK